MFGELPELKVVNGIKFGKWIDLAIKILIISKIWMVFVWQITANLPNFPKLFCFKHSHCMVHSSA